MSLYVVNVTNLPSKLNDIEHLLHNISEALSIDNRPLLGGNEIEIKIDSIIPVLTKFLKEKQPNHQNIYHRKFYNESQLENHFYAHLTEFLYTGNREWKDSFIFPKNESLVCGEKSPRLLGLKFPIHQFM